MVIIAIYTLASVVLIGRGVFCGWLCPFGALQELLGQLSRALRVPQWSPSAALEKRLWMGKYIAAAAVLALVLTGIDPAGATLDIDYLAMNCASSFRGLHEAVINYGKNVRPEILTCNHEEIAVAMGHGYAKMEGKPLAMICHGVVGLQHASMAMYNA